LAKKIDSLVTPNNITTEEIVKELKEMRNERDAKN